MTPAKVQKLVAVPAAALLHPVLFFQPEPFVPEYRAPIAAQSAALFEGSQVKEALPRDATVSSSTACRRSDAIASLAQ